MIDADALKSTIATLLSTELGIYTFSGGQTTPAIRVESGNDPYPEEPEISGLEVVIRPETGITPSFFLAGDRSHTYRSEVVLKQWDIMKTVRPAIELLMGLEGLEEVGAIVPRDGFLDTIEQCTLRLDVSFHILSRA